MDLALGFGWFRCLNIPGQTHVWSVVCPKQLLLLRSCGCSRVLIYLSMKPLEMCEVKSAESIVRAARNVKSNWQPWFKILTDNIPDGRCE